MNPRDVTACLVTYGGVDLTEALCNLPYKEVLVWDNEREPLDLKTYGRYEIMKRASNDVVYVQDDDHVFWGHKELMAAYEPGKVVTNMSPGWVSSHDYADNGMFGMGAIFDRACAEQAHARYLARWPQDEFFFFYPDSSVAVLNPVVHVDLSAFAEVMPWGFDSTRMFAQPWFKDRKNEMIARCREIRDS